MPIRPIELNGTISRVQDVATLKHNEDNKHLVNQSNLLNHSQKEIEHSQKKVRNADDSNYYQKQYDAKEKGNGSYYSNQKKKKSNSQEQENKKLKEKGHSFDISI